jgi:hypothetical protein
MKKKGKVFFNPIDGSAPLSISWYSGNKGDAVESNNENGVGFFSPTGELLCVIFDDVDEKNDQQSLEFDKYIITLKIKNSKITYELIKKDQKKSKAA